MNDPNCRKHLARHHLTLAGCSLLAAAAATAGPPTFQRFGILAGGSSSSANGVSADGLVVVGESESTAGAQAVRRVGGTLSGLGFLPGGDTSAAYACSGNGASVVGTGNDATGSFFPVHWTPPAGAIAYPCPAGSNQSQAWAVSPDGQWAAGFCGVFGVGGISLRATRWSLNPSASLDLGLLAPFSQSWAKGISENGHVAAGIAFNTGGDMSGRAFWWTSTAGMQQLPGLSDLPGSAALGLSSDGLFAVGVCPVNAAAAHAVRWRSTGNGALPSAPRDLGVIPSEQWSAALATSRDASTIVGRSGTGDPEEGGREFAFVWTCDRGMLDLRTVLSVYPVLSGQLQGWTLLVANGVSADGRVIVGDGMSPQGRHEAWVARLACRADADGDGQAQPSDVATFVNRWFNSLTNGGAIGDFDCNGIVQPADVSLFVGTWHSAIIGGC